MDPTKTIGKGVAIAKNAAKAGGFLLRFFAEICGNDDLKDVAEGFEQVQEMAEQA